ncbi:A disintegrin and metalloproteinase with thrombospondin motifs 12 [Microtus ochrogaster]|uniref:A disintegrin and metalloproteinase with thrombospondin motifs 12 n=1 Tax=Microtus ochrogaster TaxID=79684 RepID=A0A8J6KLH8_MICOH|nr:A disintegrin and metalloproteinase with thrombospondin motifs 12 [Microtus ochrogaster]
MPCAQRSWLAKLSMVAQLLNFGAFGQGRQALPGPVRFPDPRQEHFIKALPEYHVVGPVQVDASGHFLSYGVQHPVTSGRRKRAAGDSEDQVYYRISHEEKDLVFNLTVNREFMSNGYVVERRAPSVVLHGIILVLSLAHNQQCIYLTVRKTDPAGDAAIFPPNPPSRTVKQVFHLPIADSAKQIL